jgi:hypothetical protein
MPAIWSGDRALMTLWKCHDIPYRRTNSRAGLPALEKAGKSEDKEAEFWHLAEQELLNEDRSSPQRTPDNL